MKSHYNITINNQLHLSKITWTQLYLSNDSIIAISLTLEAISFNYIFFILSIDSTQYLSVDVIADFQSGITTLYCSHL